MSKQSGFFSDREELLLVLLLNKPPSAVLSGPQYSLKWFGLEITLSFGKLTPYFDLRLRETHSNVTYA